MANKKRSVLMSSFLSAADVETIQKKWGITIDIPDEAPCNPFYDDTPWEEVKRDAAEFTPGIAEDGHPHYSY